MKKWIALLLLLVCCLSVITAYAETEFQAFCDDLLGAACEELALDFQMKSKDMDIEYANMIFVLDKERVVASDAWFYCTANGVSQKQNLTSSITASSISASWRAPLCRRATSCTSS